MEERSKKSLRIGAIAREFHIGAGTIIENLKKSKWYYSWNEDWTLNSKITEEQYDWLKKQYEYELGLKEKIDHFRSLRSKKQDCELTEEDRHEYISLIPPNINNKRVGKKNTKGKRGKKGKKKNRNTHSGYDRCPINTRHSVHPILTAMGNKR